MMWNAAVETLHFIHIAFQSRLRKAAHVHATEGGRNTHGQHLGDCQITDE